MFVRPNSILRLGPNGWDPFNHFERFSNEVNHFFSDPNWNNGILSLASRAGALFSKTESGAKLKMEIPGMDPDSLQISVQGEQLTLKSTARSEDSAPKRRYLRRERLPASIDRRFKLGFTVDAEKVKASYTNGILEVDLPKIEAETPKTISVAVH